MTNGDKFCLDLPGITTRTFKAKGFTYIEVEKDDKWIADIDIEWWNSEYKEPTTKNDKVDYEHTDCNNCVNHKYCDYEPNKSEIPTGSPTKSGISNRSIIYKAKESKEIQEDLDKLSELNEPTAQNMR